MPFSIYFERRNILVRFTFEGVPVEKYWQNELVNELINEAKQAECDLKKCIKKPIKEKFKLFNPNSLHGEVRCLTTKEIITEYGKEKVIMSVNLVAQILELISKTGKLTIKDIAKALNVKTLTVTQSVNRWIIPKVGKSFNIVGPNKELGFVTPGTDWRKVLKEYNDTLGKKPEKVAPTVKLRRRIPDQIKESEKVIDSIKMREDVLKLFRQIDFILDNSKIEPMALELIQLAGEAFWNKWSK